MKLNLGYLVAEEERRRREEEARLREEQRPALPLPTPTIEEWEEWVRKRDGTQGKIKLAHEIARRTKPRFLDIPREKRITRFTAAKNHEAKYGKVELITVPDGPPLTPKRLVTLFPATPNIILEKTLRL